MTVLELEQENKLQKTDILHISELVAHAIELNDSVKKEKIVDSKETILDSLAKMLEMLLTSDINLPRERKLEVIHLLTKLKATKEHMKLVKGNIIEQKKAFTERRTSSAHMFKKSQSAFEGN